MSAQVQLEHGFSFYDAHQMRAYQVPTVHDPGVACQTHTATVLWSLGFPDQAFEKQHEAITLAQELAHPFSLAWAWYCAAFHHQLRQEALLTRENAEVLMALSQEQGFPSWMARSDFLLGWALVKKGQGESGLALMCQGMAAWQATGTELWRPYWLASLVDAYEAAGQCERGLSALTEALQVAENSQVRWNEAELYRLKGELTLQQKSQKSKGKSQKSKRETDPRSLNPDPQSEAEACFLKAIEVAQRQQAKSWELRATTSLARLWQQQGKRNEACTALAAVYNWFTEGFDTKDLQEAKALLEELSQ